MIRYLLTLVTFIFGIAVYYRGVAPAIERLLTQLEATFTVGGSSLSVELFSTISGVVLIWIPLITTAGVLLMGYLLAVGPRGTSFRP